MGTMSYLWTVVGSGERERERERCDARPMVAIFFRCVLGRGKCALKIHDNPNPCKSLLGTANGDNKRPIVIYQEETIVQFRKCSLLFSVLPLSSLFSTRFAPTKTPNAEHQAQVRHKQPGENTTIQA
jgi:hypothetical protein